MASYPPSGIDRADGTNGIGTPTPAGAVIKQPSPFFIEEAPDSPEIEASEHLTFVHVDKTDYNNAIEILNGNPRGTILEDDSGNISKVLSSALKYQKGDYAVTTITAEGISVPPPDEFDVETVEFNPSIFLHPRYATVVNYDADNEAATVTITGPQIIGWINGAVDGASLPGQQGFISQLNSDNITDPDVLALAQELVTKLKRGEDTFYLSGYRVIWAQYFNVPQPINPGGYIEDPVETGTLPYYFWSSDQTPFGDNTLISLASEVNPTIYPPPDEETGTNTISWLRQSDHITYQRIWFKITHSWIGGPIGTWDSDIYPE